MLSSQEIKELEKEWLKYKIKKHSKKAIASVSLLTLTVWGYYFYQNENPLNRANAFVPSEKTASKSAEKEVKKVERVEKEQKKTVAQIDKKAVLSLDTKFLENIEKRLEKEQKSEKKIVKEKKENSFIENGKNFSLIAKEREKKKIKIVSKKINTLTFLKKKFEATKDIKYALMVASRYYEKKEYANALKWAIKANEIDSSNEESWIIFAKSKLKLGRKKEAIDALKLYLKNRNSQNVLNVLQQIKKGNLNG